MARRISVLGPLEVVIDGIDVTPSAPKELCLLAILVLHCGRVVAADALVDELWPGLDVDRARRVLWVRIAALRRLLDRARAGALLEHSAPGYRLRVDPDDIDACDAAVPTTRHFTSLSQAADENGESRILVGYHFRDDVVQGLKHDGKIADWTVNHYLRPVRG